MATASEPAPKKSNTCLIVVIVLVVLGFMLMVGGFILIKIFTGRNSVTSTQNPLQKIVGGLTGGLVGSLTGGANEGLFDGGGGGGSEIGDNLSGLTEDQMSLERCTPGQTTLGAQYIGGYAYTGKEKFTIDGKTMSLCCMAAFDVAQGQTLANAEDKVCGDNNGTLVYTHKVDGKFVPYMAGYTKDGQDCSQIYDESGNVASNYCGQ